MKKIWQEKGFIGADISIAIVIVFIFITIIALLSYQYNSSAKEIQRRSEAINIAISEIEKVKNDDFSNYEGLNKNSVIDNLGNSMVDQPITGKQGFYKTIKVEDYTDIEGNEDKQSDIVKRVTIKISYKFNNQEQNVEMSTIIGNS